jgi:CRISPR-associated protein (TIGR02584 family)
MPSRTVLIAVTGNSPAVLTETVWALARKTPPVIPDSVVVVTTAAGAQAFRARLLSPRPGWRKKSVWQALRETILGKGAGTDSRLTLAPVVVIHAPDPGTGVSRELDDIRSPGDNTAAAETIFSVVHRHAVDGDTRLLGLLSGGRKTMSALLHAAFSLVGRSGDRLLHVLVNEPFDNPRLDPPFFFPGQPGGFPVPSDAVRHSSSAAGSAPKTRSAPAVRIDLADVPLVALGEIVRANTGKFPATFAGFTRAAAAAVGDTSLQTAPLAISFSASRHTLSIGHHPPVTISEGRPASLCLQLFKDARDHLPVIDRLSLVERWEEAGVRVVSPTGNSSTFSADDISNALNIIRNLLGGAGVPEVLILRLFPRRAPVGLVREGVTVRLDK